MQHDLDNIKAAATGLQYISESDHPLELVVMKENKEGLEKEIRALSGKGGEQNIETQTLDYFFRNHVKAYPEDSKLQTENIQRFKNLVKTLNENLSDIKVYRIGEIQVDAFIIGKLKDGRYAGLRTKLIET